MKTTTVAEVKKLVKTMTYKETAKLLDKRGVRTPTGKRPNYSFVNNVVSGQITLKKRRKN